MKTGWKLVVFAVLAGVLFASVLVYFTSNSARLDEHICTKVNRLDGAIVGILARSKAGLPANPYFARHPEQLQASLDKVQRDIDELRAAGC